MNNYITASRSVNAQRVIQIAEAEVGYKEKTAADDLYNKTASSGQGNYTKYTKELSDARFFGGAIGMDTAWCDIFVCWCYFKAFGKDVAKELLCGGSTGCSSSMQQYQEKDQFFTSNPMPGDQIFYDSDNNGVQNHTGLVYKVDSSNVYTIEGNTSGGVVAKKSHSLSDTTITGYGRPMFKGGLGKGPVYTGSTNTGFSSPGDPASSYFSSPCSSLFVVHPFGTNEDESTGKIWTNPGIDLLCEPTNNDGTTELFAIYSGSVTGKSKDTLHMSHGNIDGDSYSSSYTVINGSVTWESSYEHETGETIGKVRNISSNTVVRLVILKNGERADPSIYLFSGIYPYFEKDDKVLTNWHPMYTKDNVKNGVIGGNMNMMHSRRGDILAGYAPHMYKDATVYEEHCDGYNGVGPSSDKLLTSVQNTMAKDEVVSLYQISGPTYENLPSGADYSPADSSWGEYKKGAFGTAETETVAKYIYEYLIVRGWSPNAIFGLIGNVCGECGGNPGRWEDNTIYTDRGKQKGFGLIGWTPWNKYWDCAIRRGYNPYDIDGQLERLSNFCSSACPKYSGCPVRSEFGGDYNILWGGDYKQACFSTMTSDSSGYVGDLKDYVDRKGESFNEIDVTSYVKSSLPSDVLAMIYTFNVEKPGSDHVKPSIRSANALKYEEKLGSVVIASNSAPDKSLKYWASMSSGGVNPYPSRSGTTIPSNNAYCWGRAYQILECLNKADGKQPAKIELKLSKDSNTDWYDYNKENSGYEYGKMPRIGSIMCWTYNKQLQGASRLAPITYSAVVEDVIGNDAIAISTMRHGASLTDDTEDCYSYNIIYNYNSNWGMDPTYYTFRGFIYVTPDKWSIPGIAHDPNRGGLCVSSDGGDLVYNSISFGIPDMKHYSAIRITYDAKVSPPKDSQGNRMWTINNIYEQCDIYFYISQQVITATSNFDENFPGTYLPAKKSETDSRGEVVRPEEFGDPFPFGSVMLKHGLSKLLVTDGLHSTDSYYLSNITETFPLTEFTDSSGSVDDVFYTDENTDDNTRYFQREIQTYLGITTFAEKNTEDDNDSGKIPPHIEVCIKEIQLLR